MATQYEIKQKVIEPKRQAFDYLMKRYGNQPASRYIEATVDIQQRENFHYRPTWRQGVEIFDKNYSELKLTDYYAFLDPRQYYYYTYNATRAKNYEAVEKYFEFCGERGLLENVDESWLKVFNRYFVPFRHLEYAGWILLVGVTRFGYGTSLTQCAEFNACDKYGNAQLITRIAFELPEPDGDIFENAKKTWLEDKIWQPLREYVERLLTVQDWGEVLIGQNLALDVFVQPLIHIELDKLANENGVSVFSFFSKYLYDIYKDNMKWTEEFFKVALSDQNYGDANKKFVESKLNQYASAVSKAIDAFADVFNMPKKKGDFKTAKERILNGANEIYARLGLNVKIKN
jgi:phenol hydroxylase P1 protein